LNDLRNKFRMVEQSQLVAGVPALRMNYSSHPYFPRGVQILQY